MFSEPENIVQGAWLVRDMDESLDYWISKGAGPFKLIRHLRDVDFDCRGSRLQLDLSVAWGQFGKIQIELIQQHNAEVLSPYTKPEEGIHSSKGVFHHLAVLNQDYDKSFHDATKIEGYDCILKGSFNDTRFALIDTMEIFGFVMELTEATPGLVEFYAEVKKAAENWDGRNPIHLM